MQVSMIDNISATLYNMANAVDLTVSAFQDMIDVADRQIDVTVNQLPPNAAKDIGSMVYVINELRDRTRQEQLLKIKAAGIEQAKVGMEQLQEQLNNINKQQKFNIDVGVNLHSPDIAVRVGDIGNRTIEFRSQIEQVQQTVISIIGVSQASAELGSIIAQIQNFCRQIQTEIKVAGIKQAKSGIDSVISRIQSFSSQIQAIQQTTIRIAGIKQAKSGIDSVISRIQSFRSQIQAIQQTAIRITGTKQAKAGIDSVISRIQIFRRQIQAVQQTTIRIAGIKQAKSGLDSVISRIQNFRRQIQAVQQATIRVIGIKQARSELQGIITRLQVFQRQVQTIQQTVIRIVGIKQVRSELDGIIARFQTFRRQIQAVQQTKIGNLGSRQVNIEMGQLKQQLNSVLRVQRQISTALSKMSAAAVSKTYNQLNITISNTRRYINNNIREQQRFNDTVRKGETAANGLKGKLKGAGKALQAIAQAGFDFTTGSIDKAMQRSQIEQQLANSLARRGASEEEIVAIQQRASDIQATTIHSSTDALVGTNILSRSVFDIGNLDKMIGVLADYAAGMGNSMEFSSHQLSSVMQGSYQPLIEAGFEITERQRELIANGSEVQRAIAVRKIIGEWEGLAEQMRQTPQGMQAAMLHSISSIQTAFGKQLLPAVTLLFSTIESHLPTINKAFRALAVPVALIIGILAVMTNIVFTIAAIIIDNWSLIAPIIYGVAAALVAWNAALIYATIWTATQTAKIKLLTAKTWLFEKALAAVNAVKKASLLMKFVLIVIALVAAFNLVIAAVNRFAGTSLSVIGAVGGAFAALGAFIWNIVVGVINAVIQFMWRRFVEPMISIFEWILNVFNGGFNSFGDAVKNLLGNIISWFLSLGVVVTKIIDAIFGTNWTAGLNSLRSNVLSWGKNNDAITIDRNAPEFLSRIAYSDAWHAGYSFTANRFQSGLNGSGDGSYPSYPGYPEVNGLGAGSMGSIGDMADIANNVANIAHNTDRTAEITGENLKYWRDIAEREAINRFTTAEVNIDFGGISNTVNSNMDLDSIVNYIAEGVEEAIQITAEKSYA